MEKDRSKTTVLTISMGFLLIFLFTDISLFLYISLAVGILGLSDYMSQKIDMVWMGLTKALSYIIPNILLSLVFYFVLFPCGLIFRMLNRDPLLLSSDHETYWIEEDKEFDRESIKKPW